MDRDLSEFAVKPPPHLAKSLSDASFGTICTMLDYKCKIYGKTYVKIDTYYPSTQLCSKCGYKNEETKDLSIREWVCPVCGEKHDRDINSAINIKNEGLRILNDA